MKQILIVEDTKQVQDHIVSLLEKVENYHLYRASTGEEAFDFLMTHRMDLVLLDYHLGGVNGVDMLRNLKKAKKLNCPVVMLTTQLEAQGSEVKDLGIVTWVIKPLHEARILSLVKQILAMESA